MKAFLLDENNGVLRAIFFDNSMGDWTHTER